MPTTTIPKEVEQYEEAFHEYMKSVKSEGGELSSVRYRLLQLGFSVVDPDCPMHHYRCRAPGASRVAYWVGESDSVQGSKSAVRDAMLQLSGYGFLDANGHSERSKKEETRWRVHIPGKNEIDEICQSRVFHEMTGLSRLHLLDNQDLRDSIVEQMRYANIELQALMSKVSLVPEEERAERCRKDPRFAALADQFWKKDANFHVLPLVKTSHALLADTLMNLLTRTRLTACRRVEIISRLPSSYEEHEAIIEAAARPVTKTSLNTLREVIEKHVTNTRDFFKEVASCK